MSVWDKIVCGFSSADETLNFGSRAFDQGDTCIYEATTVATLRANNEGAVQHQPKVVSQLCETGLAIGIEKTFAFFKRDCDELVTSFNFDATIKALLVLDGGTSVCICLSDWTLVRIDVTTGKRLVFPPEYFPEIARKSTFLRFVSCKQQVFAVFNSGIVIEIENINMQVAFGGKDSVELESNPDYCFPLHLRMAEFLGEIPTCSEIITLNGRKVLYLNDAKHLYCVNFEDGEELVILSQKIEKVEVTADKRYIVCLNGIGELFLICTHTFIRVTEITKQHVEDFVLINTSVEDLTGEETILTSVLFLNIFDELCLFDVDAWKFKFKMNVPHTNCILISHRTNVDSVMYLENDAVDTMMIKFIEQTIPESRLDRLLQRGKFEQAIELARQFKLSEEPVLKAEVQWLMGTFPLWNKFPEETLNANYSKFRSILDNIEDVNFIAEVCIKTVAPGTDKTQQLINYALKRLYEKTEADGLGPIIEQVRALQLTFGTFLKVRNENSTPDDWLKFSTRNPIFICKEFISQGQVSEATIVCWRHHLQIKSELTMDMAVQDLLQTIPITTSPTGILEWLSCYVPILLKLHSRTLPHLVKFIKDRAKILEQRDRRNWPDNAINFVVSCQNDIRKLIDSKSFGSIEVIAVQQSICLPESPIDQLKSFLGHLKVLSVLMKVHHISISYELYCNGIQDEECSRGLLLKLFDVVPEHGIEKFITDFVPSFNMALNRDISSIISSYVFDLVIRYIQNRVSSDDIYWEARCIAFINCIPLLEDKLKAIGTLIEFANVPWSEQVSDLADKTLLIEHCLVAVVEKEKRLIPQKLVLKKYGFCSNVNTDDIRFLITFIYDKNKDLLSSLDDAKQLVAHDSSKNLEPYICLLVHAITNEGLDEAVCIVQRDLSKSEFEEVKDDVLAYISFKLDISKIRMKNTDPCCKTYDQMRSAITKLSSLSLEPVPFHGRASHMRSVCTLNSEYQTDYCWNDLYRKDTLQISNKCASDLVEKNVDVERAVISAASVSALIFEPDDIGLVELADKYLATGRFEEAAVALRRVCDNNRIFKTHSDRIVKLLKTAAVHCFNTLSMNKDLIETLKTTAILNMIYSAEILLMNNFLKLCKIYIVDLVKPAWSTLHSDPMEPPNFQLPPDVYNRFLSALGFENEEPVAEQLQENLVKMCQSLPKDLVSLSRIQDLCCLLGTRVPLEPGTLKEIKHANTVICRNMLMNIFSSPRKPDLQLALTLIQNFSPEHILPWLKYVSRHQRDMKFCKYMSLAAKNYCTYHKEVISKDEELTKLASFFSELNNVSTWSLRARRYGIPYKEALADTIEERKAFLNRLITVNDIELSVLEAYCKDMGLDVQECYLLHIKHALLSWTPKYKTFKTSSGKSEIIFEDNVDALVVKCQTLISKSQNSEDLIKMLLKKDFWDQINTYYYEIFTIIFELAGSLYPRRFLNYLNVLVFLKGYTKIGPIQDEESTEWFSMNPGVSELPEIAHYRLSYRSWPFSTKMIKPEVSLDNYKQWRDAPPFFFQRDFDQSMIFSFAITNLRNTEQPVSSSGWNLHHGKRNLLEKVMECVEQMENHEMSVASLYFVVNLMPPGIDQVEAAQKCYLTAERWRRESRTEVASGKFIKAEKKYFTVSTQHILHASGLGKPEYLSLAIEPTRLINELYNDPAIIEEDYNKTPNVNEAVERIMILHDLDPVKTILELLTQWLSSETLNATLSDSMFNCSEETNDEDNITRACYMLLGNKHSADIEKYLVGQAFPKNPDTASKPHCVRLRALKILLAITTQEQLELITARDIHTIRSHLQVLDFLNELERFGMAVTFSSFELTRKEGFIDTLLQYKQVPAARLALKMCRAYASKNVKLMSRTLSHMNNLGMIDELEEVLVDMSITQTDVRVLEDCWKSVITRCILKAEGYGTSPDPDPTEVAKLTRLLYSCPAIEFLELNPIKSFFVKINDIQVIKFLNNFA